MAWIDKLMPRRAAKRNVRAQQIADEENAGAVTLAEQLRLGRRPSTAPQFPKFRTTASDQLDPKHSDRFGSVRMRLRAAFTPSQPVTDRRVFAGRTEILNGLIRAIEERRLHVVLYGERGLGKTSVLHVLAHAARDARYLVLYVSCGAASNFDEVFRSVAGHIPMLFHSGIGPTSPDAEKGKTLADLLPAGPISARIASDMLAKVVGTRVIVVLDEFDRCESAAFRLSVAELLKNLSDRSVRVQLVIAGVAHNLAELIEHIPSIQRNLYALQLPRMDAGEVRQLVKNGEEVSSLKFDDVVTAAIINVSNGFPYLASLLSHHAGLHALDEGRTIVAKDDLTAAIASALDELRGRVSKKAQADIAECDRAGQLQLWGALAGAAQLSGGDFDADEIAGLADGIENAERAKRLVDMLASKNALIARRDELPLSYRFLEESIPPYLWLLSAQARLSETAQVVPITQASAVP